MTFAVLMILASLALLTIPSDVKPLMQVLRYQLFLSDALPEDFDDQYQGLVYTMYGLGGALLAISLSMFPMCYILRKRNMNKDTEGVLKMLKIICYVNTKYIKAFIFLQDISFIVVLIGVLTGSFYLSVSLSQFWIFLLGIMVMMCFTFIWIFDMGFIITLYTMLEEKERSGNVYTKMEEVNVA